MARFERPVTKIISVMPELAASSTAYWMRGLSTIGSISFGHALVAGRKRVPSPATGKTARRIFLVMARLSWGGRCVRPELQQDACHAPWHQRTRVLAHADGCTRRRIRECLGTF